RRFEAYQRFTCDHGKNSVPAQSRRERTCTIAAAFGLRAAPLSDMRPFDPSGDPPDLLLPRKELLYFFASLAIPAGSLSIVRQATNVQVVSAPDARDIAERARYMTTRTKATYFNRTPDGKAGPAAAAG
ncbi:MAG TPA: hypothetical protein VEH77_16885, partial [Roseiarcus sp.]|nr:hypothetical protein [Roseiarcus sp.]